MTLNSIPAEKGALTAGELLFIRDQLLLLCCERPNTLQHRYFPLQQSGSFGGPDCFGIVGESPAAWELREQLAFCAASDRHVLVLGESGTGKELAARALHQLSSRKHRPLVARNAATFPATLIDAELFGNAPNFPNAGMPARVGVIGEAHESTLLLDEIGEMPAELQAHLLRVLDRGGEYQRLGESQMRRSSLRLVAATNRDPTELRLDLLARLPLQVQMPSLRDRPEDIPLLLRHLLKQATHQRPELVEQYFMSTPEGPEPRIDPELIGALVRYPFTANIRDLEQFMWKALAQSTGKFVVLARELRGGSSTPIEAPATLAERLTVRAPTADDILRSLDAQGHNVASAAKALGLPSRYALYRLMRKFGIVVERVQKADTAGNGPTIDER